MNDENRYMDDDSLQDAKVLPEDAADDAALDALMMRFGADYNRPPDIVPGEEMWHTIRRQIESRPPVSKRPVWGFLAAAVLLLGIGIGIGVEAHSRVATRSSSVASSNTGVKIAPSRASSIDRDTGTATIPDQTAGQTVALPQTAVAPAAVDGSYASNAGSSELRGSARSTAYTLATVRHFTAAEALITSFQASSHDARSDAQMAAWARALLSQTRLLIDSPAAKDPARKQLLQDLELVLVQMTQLSPADTPVDREMIDGSVRHTDVITRLRTAVPAGSATTL
jgi:hypothetical protein